MLKSIPFAVLTAALAASLSAQTKSPARAGNKDKSVPLVLTGCVASPKAGTLTVQDEKKGRFELTGHGLDIYIGKRVEVRGRSQSALHITTGLYPSPNVAAQAGAIDPVRAAEANMPGNPDRQHPAALPKITVTQVRAVKDDCK